VSHDHPVNLRRPFADSPNARLPVPTLERKLLGDAVATVDLHSGIDDAAEDLARAAKETESMRSSTPPWPSIVRPQCFAPRSRLTPESTKPPRKPATTMSPLSTAAWTL
jgi:hypothetical protein